MAQGQWKIQKITATINKWYTSWRFVKLKSEKKKKNKIRVRASEWKRVREEENFQLSRDYSNSKP